MNSLYQQFGFAPAAFNRMLRETGSFVAGGAALHMLCGKDPKDFDGDLDIWYTNAPHREAKSEDSSYLYHIVKINAYRYASKYIEEYLESHGYTLNKDWDFTKEYTNSDSSLKTEILKVHTYEGGGKKVQVIYAYGGPQEILDSFDYSFCSVACDDSGRFFGKALELAKQGKGFVMMPSKDLQRDAMRREKYAKRGFTLI